MSDEQTAQSIPRALVTLRARTGEERTVSTDIAGTFTFAELASGYYTLTASKPAYLTTPYSASSSAAPTPLAISAEGITGITIRLRRGAVIDGVVTNVAGEPVSGLQIDVQNAAPNGDLRRVGEGQTDDRGRYRVFGLPEGQYVVAANLALLNNQRNRSIARPSRAEIDAVLRSLSASAATSRPSAGSGPVAFEGESSVVFASVYFPGVPVADDATIVTLHAGDERTGVDFIYSPTETVAVTGAVTGSAGNLANVQVMIQSVGRAAGAATRQGALPVEPDGTFRARRLQPGRYRLLARMRPPAADIAGTLYATADVDARAGNVGGVSLVLQPGGTLRGAVHSRATNKQADLSAVRISLLPLDLARSPIATSVINTARDVRVGPDGRFAISGIAPGRYALTVNLGIELTNAGWLARSATVQEHDYLDEPVAMAPGMVIDGMTVTLLDASASISGTLLKSSGAAVLDLALVLFSADQNQWRNGSRRSRLIVPASDGRFQVAGLPGGDYLLASIPAADAARELNASLFGELVQRATRITLQDGERKPVALRIDVP